jgi:hypothetical protein
LTTRRAGRNDCAKTPAENLARAQTAYAETLEAFVQHPDDEPKDVVERIEASELYGELMAVAAAQESYAQSIIDSGETSIEAWFASDSPDPSNRAPFRDEGAFGRLRRSLDT